MNVTCTFDQVEFGKRIKNARQKLHFTRSDVAKKLGVTPQAVGNWERSRNSPEIGCLIRLSEVLNVSLDFLFTGVEYSFTAA